jgi:DNA-binding HxlR family transcriptional regulator
MNTVELRSQCHINFSLETFGDSWSLLILRDIVYFGKKTFSEFLHSDEQIARNILADRLQKLQQRGLLEKISDEDDKRKGGYVLTEAGLDLIPILVELADWGAVHGAHAAGPQAWLEAVRGERRQEILALARRVVREGDAIFAGQNSVVQKLSLANVV